MVSVPWFCLSLQTFDSQLVHSHCQWFVSGKIHANNFVLSTTDGVMTTTICIVEQKRWDISEKLTFQMSQLFFVARACWMLLESVIGYNSGEGTTLYIPPDSLQVLENTWQQLKGNLL